MLTLLVWLLTAPAFAAPTGPATAGIIIEDSRPTKPLIIEDSRNPLSAELPTDVLGYLYWWRDWLLAQVSSTHLSD